MRTTIEIPDELRARLLDLAARRGLKGYSVIIEEALELYLRGAAGDEARLQALEAIGSLGAREAEALRSSVRSLREHWR